MKAPGPASSIAAIDVYADLQKCRDAATCGTVFKRAVATYAVDVFACGEVDLFNKSATVFYILEWPKAWRDFYIRSKFVETDPTVERLRVSRTPFTWTELKRERRLDKAGLAAFREVAKHGWREGLVIPVDRGGGFCGLVSLVGRAPRFSAAERRQLCLMSEALLGRVRALGPLATYPAPPAGLSPRELEAVRLVATGCTDAEIASAMGISRPTAHQHVETARRRLDARSRAHLTAKAVTLGLAAQARQTIEKAAWQPKTILYLEDGPVPQYRFSSIEMRVLGSNRSMMQNGKTSALGALALCALAAPAYADPVAYGTTYGAGARAEAGSQVDNIFSTITTIDGSVTNNQINQSDGGGGVSGSGSTTNSSNAFVPNVGAGQTGYWTSGPNVATTSASANLYNGTIHLSIVGSGPQRYGSPAGAATGTIGDLVTFNNISGHVIDLGVSFALDGTFSGFPITGGGSFGHNVTAESRILQPEWHSLSARRCDVGRASESDDRYRL